MIGLVIAIICLIGCVMAGKMIDERYYGGLKKAMPIIGIVACVIIIIVSCVSYVPTGYTGIVTTFGKVHDEVLDAGLNFHAPWDNVIKMDNREQRITFNLEAFSKDIQQVDVQGSINYNIDKSTAMNLYKDVGTNYSEILIGPRINEDVKIIMARYTAENLIENRQKAADAIYELIKNELAPKGINVISFAIENIDFTDAFESAVEAKQVATQEKQKAQTQQEQQTMEATQAAERQRIAAQAEADVKKIDADADAYATKIKAEAEAEANDKINKSLTDQLISYNQMLRWDGKLPTFMGGDSMIPVLDFTGAE
jgi:regulator of protease activity HflC (stomatin/prohibitin superfamily)